MWLSWYKRQYSFWRHMLLCSLYVNNWSHAYKSLYSTLLFNLSIFNSDICWSHISMYFWHILCMPFQILKYSTLRMYCVFYIFVDSRGPSVPLAAVSFFLERNSLWISRNVLFLVSGTTKKMYVATKQQITRKTRKQYCFRPFWER